MDNITRELKYWLESMVDFGQNEIGEIKENLFYNETLSREIKKLEGELNSYSNNILYIDSTSRALTMRQLKITMQFIGKFMPYKVGHHEKYPEKNFHSFQFFKYICFQGFTPGNYPILFYGNTKEINDSVLLARYLKENCSITNYYSDECKKDNTRIYHNLIQSEIYEHQMLLCDQNEVEMNRSTKKCLYGHINSFHLYEYGRQFWIKYKDNRKFSAMIANDGHENSLEAFKYNDDITYNFINYYLEYIFNIKNVIFNNILN